MDQIRTVDRERLGSKLGRISPKVMERSLFVLQEMFAV
ncbi:MAG: type II toxin-antitoxin system PemK/MazF family toxin [Gemmatimonadota bacterium]|nr:type II toxin-antitoxin system PemK/MazF family toxin [Gemmatimonadota bacterium]